MRPSHKGPRDNGSNHSRPIEFSEYRSGVLSSSSPPIPAEFPEKTPRSPEGKAPSLQRGLSGWILPPQNLSQIRYKISIFHRSILPLWHRSVEYIGTVRLFYKE